MFLWSFLIITRNLALGLLDLDVLLKRRFKLKFIFILTFFLFHAMLVSCRFFSKGEVDAIEEDILEGTIADPFTPTKPVGINAQKEKFVIKSMIGQTEYAIEIPGAGDDYDIEIPLADIQSNKDKRGVGGRFLEGSPSNPVVTDQELVARFPKPITSGPALNALDKALGVAPEEGITQSPSYILGLAKISQLYKLKQFELALVEINYLLESYPTSTKLYKMKGTVLLKLGDTSLAQVAWAKALELNPSDAALKQSLDKLK